MIKRIGTRNGGFLLSSLYLCRLTFRVIEDARAFLVMLYICCFLARRILSCGERYSVHSKGDIGEDGGENSWSRANGNGEADAAAVKLLVKTRPSRIGKCSVTSESESELAQDWELARVALLLRRGMW